MSEDKQRRLATIRASNAAKSKQDSNSTGLRVVQSANTGYEETKQDLPAFVLTFRKTPLMFWFIEHPDDFNLFLYRYTTFTRNFRAIDVIGEYTSIEHPIEVFRTWLDQHIQVAINDELEPNLWSNSHEFHNILGIDVIKNRDTSNFSENEVLMIDVAIERFADLIEDELSPDEEQSQQIREDLGNLAKSTRKLNRFEFQGFVISTLTGIIINLAIDTDKGRILYELFLKALDSAKYLLK